MTVIYQNFAENFKELSQTTVGDRTTLVEGQRAYIINGQPYFCNVHFERVSESWMTHEVLQRHFKSNTALQKRIWAGTAGEVNLAYITATKAPAAILFDINPFQTLFWNKFFTFVSETPDHQEFAQKSQQFIKEFYYDLSNQFNLASIQKDHPGLHMKAPVTQQYNQEGFISSPIRNMTYRDFYQQIRGYLGWKEIGFTSCADKDLQWIANKENYTHLHLMAKNNAVAAVTLDISDTPSCEQLRYALEHATYKPAHIIKGDIKACSPTRQGALIENMYLSNILYYFDYSVEEIEKCQKEGAKPQDFTGNEVSPKSLTTTLDNLRSLVCEDAAVLRFDALHNPKAHFTNFSPLLKGEGEDINIPRANEVGGLAPL